MLFTSSYVLVESKQAAAMPRRFKASTWSFIKAIRGDTTIVIPEPMAAVFDFLSVKPAASSSSKAIPGIYFAVSSNSKYPSRNPRYPPDRHAADPVG